MARQSTGKRLRFKIFERDNFTCQYCGKKPPEVILHLDHIYPVSKGGKNEIENMLTACADCNLGKATLEIGKAPSRVLKNSGDLRERYDQLRAFYNLQKKLDTIKQEMIIDITNYWSEIWEDSQLGAKGIASMKRFLKDFSVDEIKEAMDIARAKISHPINAFKYTCGVLCTKLKQRKLKTNDDNANY